MKKILVLVMLILTILAGGCSSAGESISAPDGIGKQVSVSGGAYTDISVNELQTMLQNKDFTFINVHIPFEGDIAGTDLSIPYDEIEQNLDLLPADKAAKIVLYCRSDRMSRIAAETLLESGYTNVWNLDGGFVEWEQAGLPIER